LYDFHVKNGLLQTDSSRKGGAAMEENEPVIENDMADADVAAERAMMRERADRVRRRLGMNLTLPLCPAKAADEREQAPECSSPN
jgi:hypothetical protein